MPEIRNREEAPVQGLDYSEIHIPDDTDLGTGTFKTVLKEDILGKENPIISGIGNEPSFLMVVTINTGIEEVNVMLGKSEKEQPLSKAIFKMSKEVDAKTPHTIDAHFAGWKITGLELDGEKLEIVE